MNVSDAKLGVGVTVCGRASVQLPDEKAVSATKGVVVKRDRVDGRAVAAIEIDLDYGQDKKGQLLVIG